MRQCQPCTPPTRSALFERHRDADRCSTRSRPRHQLGPFLPQHDRRGHGGEPPAAEVGRDPRAVRVAPGLEQHAAVGLPGSSEAEPRRRASSRLPCGQALRQGSHQLHSQIDVVDEAGDVARLHGVVNRPDHSEVVGCAEGEAGAAPELDRRLRGGRRAKLDESGGKTALGCGDAGIRETHFFTVRAGAGLCQGWLIRPEADGPAMASSPDLDDDSSSALPPCPEAYPTAMVRSASGGQTPLVSRS